MLKKRFHKRFYENEDYNFYLGNDYYDTDPQEDEIWNQLLLGKENASGFRLIWVPVLAESRFSRIMDWIMGQKAPYKEAAWAILTAWKTQLPDGRFLSKKENLERMKELAMALAEKDLTAIPIEGVGKEEHGESVEQGYFIIGVTRSKRIVPYDVFKKIIETLAIRYDQFGYIIYDPAAKEAYYMERTSGKTYEKAGVYRYVQIASDPDQLLGMYFTRIKRRSFQLQDDETRKKLGLHPRSRIGGESIEYRKSPLKYFIYEGILVPEKAVIIEGDVIYEEVKEDLPICKLIREFFRAAIMD